MDWPEKMKRTVAVARAVETRDPSDDLVSLLAPLEAFTEDNKHTGGDTWESLEFPHRTWEWLGGQWINALRGGHFFAINTLLNQTFCEESEFKAFYSTSLQTEYETPQSVTFDPEELDRVQQLFIGIDPDDEGIRLSDLLEQLQVEKLDDARLTDAVVAQLSAKLRLLWGQSDA